MCLDNGVHLTWWESPLCIADFGVGGLEDDIESGRLDLEGIARRKAELGFNAEHFGPFHFGGGEKGIFYFQSKSALKMPTDLLKDYLPYAHKNGIKVLIYFNVHWLHPDLASLHPDWLQRKSNGAVIDDVYGKGMSPCVNSPAYREWSFQVIRDLAGYDIEGVFLDGPIFIASGCYCDACKEKFRKLYAEELPAREDWESPVWKKFIEFRYQSITDYMRDARSVLKEKKSDAIIYMNGQGLWPSWPNGRDNRRLAEYQDLVGAEGGFIGGDLLRIPLWKPAMSAKLLEAQASGKPRIIFIAGKDCSWDNYLLTPMETKLLYADTIAHGASPWYGIFSANSNDPGAKAAGEMNAIIRKIGGYLESTSSLANVALLWSTKSADFYRATVPVTDFTQEGEKLTRQVRSGDHFKAFCGYFEALTRAHIPFDVLDEESLREGKLSNYEALVLPNVACLSQENARTIKEWVGSGGILISTFETSFYDEWGNLLPTPGLSEVFGVEADGIEGPCPIDYMEVEERDPLLHDLHVRLIPSARFRVHCTLHGGKALSYYLKKLPARYQPLPPPSCYPGIIRTEYGRGKSIYFAGSFDELYGEFHNPDIERLLVAPVRAVGSRLLVTDAPSSVEISLRIQPCQGRVIVHLINFTGEMTRPIQRVIGIKEVNIRLPGVKRADSVRALVSEQDIGFVENDGLEFAVRDLGVYEAIAIEGTEG